MATTSTSKAPLSAGWTLFDGWDYNGMKERLEMLLSRLDKSARIRHAERIKGQNLTMSDPLPAGQYWVCFEMIAEDGRLVIARVRLPRHPGTPGHGQRGRRAILHRLRGCYHEICAAKGF